MLENVHSLENDIMSVIIGDKENITPPTQSMNVATTTIDTMTKLTNAIAGLETRINIMEKSTYSNSSNQNKDPNFNIPFWERPNNRFLYCWSCGSNQIHIVICNYYTYINY